MSITTRTSSDLPASPQQLADLATLLGLMQAAAKISEELQGLAHQVGGSLEKIAERFGVPFEQVHQTYVDQIDVRKPKTKKPRKTTSRR
jgi:hypothetical protein